MKIDSQIHMGNGEHTMAQCYYLHQQLDKAFNLLSGMQQARGEETCDSEMEFEWCVNDIVMGLTGVKYNSNHTNQKENVSWAGHNPQNLSPSEFPRCCVRFLEEYEKNPFWDNYPATSHIYNEMNRHVCGGSPDETYATTVSEEDLYRIRRATVLSCLANEGWKVGATTMGKPIHTINLWQPGMDCVNQRSIIIDEYLEKGNPFVYVSFGNRCISPIDGMELDQSPTNSQRVSKTITK